MNNISATEQKDINSVPVSELDRQIMLGNWYPVCINDGRIIGTADME